MKIPQKEWKLGRSLDELITHREGGNVQLTNCSLLFVQVLLQCGYICNFDGLAKTFPIGKPVFPRGAYLLRIC